MKFKATEKNEGAYLMRGDEVEDDVAGTQSLLLKKPNRFPSASPFPLSAAHRSASPSTPASTKPHSRTTPSLLSQPVSPFSSTGSHHRPLPPTGVKTVQHRRPPQKQATASACFLQTSSNTAALTDLDPSAIFLSRLHTDLPFLQPEPLLEPSPLSADPAPASTTTAVAPPPQHCQQPLPSPPQLQQPQVTAAKTTEADDQTSRFLLHQRRPPPSHTAEQPHLSSVSRSLPFPPPAAITGRYHRQG
eukprot:XP_024442555.1 uncharacterized protein LOC112324367 [Populus trichocarpa]